MSNQLSEINSTKTTLKMKLCLLVICVWLLGCGGCGKEKIYIGREMRNYEIVSLNFSIQFSVDLLDVETHRLYKSQGVSKFCDNWRGAKLGDIVTIGTYTFKYKDENVEHHELLYVNDYFCK